MHDKVVAQLIRDAYNDPLVDTGGSYNRQYDVLEYYQAGNPLTRDSMFDEWYVDEGDDFVVFEKEKERRGVRSEGHTGGTKKRES